MTMRPRRQKRLAPLVVRLRVNCPCGHADDKTYGFGVPADEAQPLQAHEPGKCPSCEAPIQIHLVRTSGLQ